MDAYDVIIIGTGAGGGTLARHLAPSGKRILLLERGDWLPREPENWQAAVDLMERLLRVASPLGLYAEEFDADTGRHLGNFPQAFSHLALIEAAGRIILAELTQEIS